MFQDHKGLLSAFHAHGVKYLIVGGYAVISFTRSRVSQTISIFS
jgi:hypothetical protein